ncbi:hypothetical protein AMELA_G00097050 [Ameiurus melas]|uniref:Protein atonal homolog 8 n=1 Tax=Ameiurus melas TaxID=219545 RepID=A0A7J6ART0_AMEME|nr:hypothetical protein AMELA_G00097050 [Ameiurus melas]
MKNSHVNTDRTNPTDECKKFKRKLRDSVKREEKSSHESKKSLDSVGPLLEQVYGKTRENTFQPFDPAGEYIQQPDIFNAALDMKVYTLPSLSRNETETPLWSSSETGLKNRSDTASLQESVFDHQQAFPANCPPPHSRILFCKRSERSLCSASRGSYLQTSAETTESVQKPAEEQTAGVVTEIRAIQQTRRLLANARERTRVHTISAAFEALRKQVPCYSYGQKLSKLAILRIACNYILSLAQLVDLDYTPDHSNMSFRECVEQCTRTLQAEGRSKKRKE